jgi:hypothetical protein
MSPSPAIALTFCAMPTLSISSARAASSPSSVRLRNRVRDPARLHPEENETSVRIEVKRLNGLRKYEITRTANRTAKVVSTGPRNVCFHWQTLLVRSRLLDRRRPPSRRVRYFKVPCDCIYPVCRSGSLSKAGNSAPARRPRRCKRGRIAAIFSAPNVRAIAPAGSMRATAPARN